MSVIFVLVLASHDSYLATQNHFIPDKAAAAVVVVVLDVMQLVAVAL